MRRDEEVLRQYLAEPANCGTLLDCASGIGTQVIALARLGYQVEGSDSSEASIARARAQAAHIGLSIPFRVDDVRWLETAPENHYGAAIALDNILPHLGTMEDIKVALGAIRGRLRAGGVLLAGIRDYDPILANRPTGMPPSFSENTGGRRIFHEVWDWHDERRYTCHVYVSNEISNHWEVMHFTGHYCAIMKCEMADLFRECGFVNVEILVPEQTGFHQPLIRGERS